ncbi:MAG: glycosyltransferase [Verrucomicrobia bacterium]|nr:glycosyltransferase [Verrucomicrobiota bacterium]
MRILRVIASLDPKMGGPSQGIRNSIPALAAIGIENEVVCCDTQGSAWLDKDPFPVHAVGPSRFGYAYSSALGQWMDANLGRFDAIISHGLWLWPGLASFRAWEKIGKPGQRFFAMPHGMLDPWFQRDRSRRLKAFRNFFYWWLAERRVVNGADALFFTCDWEMQLARETFGGYRPRRELNIGYGVPEPPAFSETMRAAFSAKVPNLGDKPYLLFLGRIHPKKGVDLLVRAYCEILKKGFPDLVVAGPGWDSEYGTRIKSLIREQEAGSLERGAIHAVEMLEGDAKWGGLYGCEALVLPSHQENFGIAVAEALACNKPVLISNKVNIWREVVEDGAGVAAGDDLAGTTELLRAFPETSRNEDMNRFRKSYRKRFGIDAAAQKMAGVLRDSLSWV